MLVFLLLFFLSGCSENKKLEKEGWKLNEDQTVYLKEESLSIYSEKSLDIITTFSGTWLSEDNKIYIVVEDEGVFIEGFENHEYFPIENISFNVVNQRKIQNGKILPMSIPTYKLIIKEPGDFKDNLNPDIDMIQLCFTLQHNEQNVSLSFLSDEETIIKINENQPNKLTKVSENLISELYQYALKDSFSNRLGKDTKRTPYFLNNMVFSVPHSWIAEKDNKDSISFYAKDIVFGVTYIEKEVTVHDDEFRTDFRDGLDIGDLISESEISIDGTLGYQYDFIMHNREWKNSIVIFNDYNDPLKDGYTGVIVLRFSTLFSSDKDNSKEFENIISSIVFSDEISH